GDLSLNNLIIHEGQDYFIDFGHMQIITYGNTSCYLCEKGLKLTMTEQTAADDLEWLFYIFVTFIITYDGPQTTITKDRIIVQ
ncbi:hypothetical protein P692DRAFT_20757558, partial [Suillus brevipes Sb2]